MADQQTDYDLFVIGGGINGCGIARDAAGRGLRVGLAEMKDLAWATSSASTKLFHGGLRYLEYFEFGLVRHSLVERERLLKTMPHISWPMRFVLPYASDMRFDSETPTSRLLARFMPWMKGRRPAWLIRLGLFLYDTLGGREILPGTKTLDLRRAPEGEPLDDRFQKAFEYSDCWVEDSRLVVLNARDAAARGADIMTRTKLTSARRDGDRWVLTLDGDVSRQVTAKVVVNAGGPWVEDILRAKAGINSTEGVRLVRGSHIVVPKMYDHGKCYFFQGTDGRIIFAIPYETDFTLIGTTDAEHDAPDTAPNCTPEERDYLIKFANGYFKQDLTADDVVWTYSGVRPLYDDGAASASAATRDYVLTLDQAGAPMLHVFGGKITTFRKLAEDVMDKLAPVIPGLAGHWTEGVPMPGGDFPVREVEARVEDLKARYPFLSDVHALRLFRAYGTEVDDVLDGAASLEDLGEDFGATLTAREVDWLVAHEWVKAAEDVIWRRSKLGLRLSQDQVARLDAYLADAQKVAAQ